MVRVRLFGPFQAFVDERQVLFPTRPVEALLAYLCVHAGRAVPRAEAAQAIWPDASGEQAGNRLRNALVHLRRALPGEEVLVADRSTLCVHGIETDLSEAQRMVLESRIEQQSDGERTLLQRLLELLSRDLLEGYDDIWAVQVSTYWSGIRDDAAMRLARSSQALGLDEDALHYAASVLERNPWHEEAWASTLRSAHAAGMGTAWHERFQATRRKLRITGEDFSSELQQVAAKYAGPGAMLPSLKLPTSDAEKELLTRLLQGQIEEDPLSVLPLIASDHFFRNALRYPREAWSLLRRLIERTEGTSPDRIAAVVRAIHFGNMFDEYGTALDYAEWLVDELPETEPAHRTACSMLGFINFELREWQEAERWLARCEELCARHGDLLEQCSARAQGASLRWHLMEYDEAEQRYLEVNEKLQNDSRLRAQMNVIATTTNLGFVACMRQDWPLAAERFDRAQRLASATGDYHSRMAQLSAHGLALTMTGRPAEGRRLAAEGLSQTFRARFGRFHQISADYSAGVLAATGHGSTARAVLGFYGEERRRRSHGRSPAEEVYAGWVQELADSSDSRGPSFEGFSQRTFVAAVCEILSPISGDLAHGS